MNSPDPPEEAGPQPSAPTPTGPQSPIATLVVLTKAIEKLPVVLQFFILAAATVLYAAGYWESPQRREDWINARVGPIEQRLTRLEQLEAAFERHEARAGHYVMEERMATVQRMLGEIRDDVNELRRRCDQ